jgi:hypothetical protein
MSEPTPPLFWSGVAHRFRTTETNAVEFPVAAFFGF